MGKHLDCKTKYNYVMRYLNGESPSQLGKELILLNKTKKLNYRIAEKTFLNEKESI